MTTEFYGANAGEDYQQSSEPILIRQVHESDLWPVHDNSVTTKDSLLTTALVYNGVHPVVAFGGRTVADGRPQNATGIVVDVTPGLTLAKSLVRVNFGDKAVVRNYVANVLTYSGTVAQTFEQAPIPGQPVYIDDSSALAAGVTLSFSPVNNGTPQLPNPLAGWLMYCQDEYANDAVGGPNVDSTFDVSLANELVQQEYCIMLTNDSGQTNSILEHIDD